MQKNALVLLKPLVGRIKLPGHWAVKFLLRYLLKKAVLALCPNPKTQTVAQKVRAFFPRPVNQFILIRLGLKIKKSSQKFFLSLNAQIDQKGHKIFSLKFRVLLKKQS